MRPIPDQKEIAMRRFISGAVVATIFWYAFGTAQEKRGKIVFPDKD